jgi:hypothetical protein
MSDIRVAAFELFQLRGQALHLFFQLLETLQEACVGLAGGFQEAALPAVRSDRRSVPLRHRVR